MALPYLKSSMATAYRISYRCVNVCQVCFKRLVATVNRYYNTQRFSVELNVNVCPTYFYLEKIIKSTDTPETPDHQDTHPA